MNFNEFDEFYRNDLLDKLSKENMTAFLLGDFNINPLNYDHDTSRNEFLDSLYSHLLASHTLQPTRVRGNSKTLIDNIFSNAIFLDMISGNLTPSNSDYLPSNSDYLPQFFTARNIFVQLPKLKILHI